MFRWPRKKNMLLSHCAENNTFRLPLRSSNLKGQCHLISDLYLYCSKCFIWALYEHSKTVSQIFLFWQRFAKSMTKRTPEEGFWQNKRGSKISWHLQQLDKSLIFFWIFLKHFAIYPYLGPHAVQDGFGPVEGCLGVGPDHEGERPGGRGIHTPGHGGIHKPYTPPFTQNSLDTPRVSLWYFV